MKKHLKENGDETDDLYEEANVEEEDEKMNTCLDVVLYRSEDKDEQNEPKTGEDDTRPITRAQRYGVRTVFNENSQSPNPFPPK